MGVETGPSLCEVGGKGTLVLPLFGDAEQRWPAGLRITLYILGLGWCFMGVALISDVFMGAIERITSRRSRRFSTARGRNQTVHVWNATVANLTLMALGSSAPEILLSVIEITAMNKMFSGDLGPATIVGSAAFNLLIIIAVCVQAIPDGEVRRIKEVQVYCVTASFSIFAYLWMIIVLLGFSPHVVEPWEGILTFLFFPVLVFLAYLADVGYLTGGRPPAMMNKVSQCGRDITREDLADLQVKIKREYGGNVTDDQVTKIISIRQSETFTRAHYRVNATRKLLGGRPVMQKRPMGGRAVSGRDFLGLGGMSRTRVLPFVHEEDETPTCSIEFASANYAVLENSGVVRVKVLRKGVEEVVAIVNYKTRDGTAKAWTEDFKGKLHPDYIKVEGTLNFGPGEMEKFIDIKILDDNTYEEDEEFFVDLFDMVVVTADSSKSIKALLLDAVTREVVPTATACVTIIDDDMAGCIAWAREETHLPSLHEDRWVNLNVVRRNGTKGLISCSYKTENATALAGTDYVAAEGEVELQDGVTVAQVRVKLLAKGRYGTSDCFRVILEDVKGHGAKFDASTDGGADCCITTVYIDADMASMEKVDRMMSHIRCKWDKAKIGHSSWKEQIKAAIILGDEDDEGSPSWADYMVHVLTLPWKLVFALCPPVDYCGGWLCFCVSLAMIGGVTAVIGDIANLFGCVLPFMENEITAITFVALGTSLPDTFASKTAAEQDPHADASVGNVTGSNSVNVFLGLGLPWMIASLYWTLRSPDRRWDERYQYDPELWRLGPPGHRRQAYVVKAGSLVFSVTIFACCAVVCIAILFLRRRYLGGELGGPKVYRRLTATALVSLWVLYIFLSVLNVKGVV